MPFSEGHTHKAAPPTRHRHRQHYIPSTKFLSLSGPVAYHQTIDRVDEESITVIMGLKQLQSLQSCSQAEWDRSEYREHFPELAFIQWIWAIQ